MPTGQTFTRWDGTVVPQSQANFGDYLFHGSGEINPALRALISMTPYAGGIYTAGRGFNALMTYLGQHGLFGHGSTGTVPPINVTGTPMGAPSGAGGFLGDPTDPNNPNNFVLPGGAPTQAAPQPPPRSFQTPTALLSSNARNSIGLGTPGFANGYGGTQFGGDQAYQAYIDSRTQK